MSNDENQVHGGAGSVGGGGEEGAGGEGGSLRAAFELALSMSGTERAAYLERVGAGDFARRVQLEEMLRAAESDPTFLSSPTGAPTANVGEQTRERRSAPLLERPGTKIGLYKLLQHIGEGGFGTVFLAEQDKPVRRRVALKILKLGMDTKSIIARFEAERQALALMDHPHIARVLDAGATESGRPFFVMEYVVGDAITRFADAHKLGVQDRLGLFQQVCQAVQHAHTKGVIHRDLKPGNVLVSMSDGKPFAKVIDFGIAKATSQPLTDKTLFTEHRQLLGTPEYMSPEQADGSPDIDTRTDVYALGVLLYELLTGATPFDAKRLRSAAYAEMQRIIKEEEPPLPSVRLKRDLTTLAETAAARQLEPAKLNSVVKGELDWIVMKSLDKDRSRRYEGASSLAADVQRHLAGEPVFAAPVSRAYRVRKFVRKNKGAVGAVSAVMLALAAGGSAAAWQWRNAQAAINAKNARDAEVERTLSRVQTRLSDGNANARLGWVTRSGPDGKVEFGVEVVTTPLSEEPQVARPATMDSGDERLKMLAALAADSVERLASQRDRANEGVGQMMSILTGGATVGPIVSSSPNGKALQTDPLERAIGMGVQMAESLKSERDKLVAQNTQIEQSLKMLLEEMGMPPVAFVEMDVRDAAGNVSKQTVLIGNTHVDEAASKLPDSDLAVLTDFAVSAARTAREKTDAAEWSAYTANLALAQAALAAADFPGARSSLDRAARSRRGWEHSLVLAMADANDVVVPGDFRAAWVDDRSLFVVERESGRVRAFSRATGEQLADPAAFAEDSQRDGFVGSLNGIRYWEKVPEDRLRRLGLPPPMTKPGWVGYRESPDRSSVIQISDEGVRVVSESAGLTYALPDPGRYLGDAAITRDGKHALIWLNVGEGGGSDARVIVARHSAMGGPEATPRARVAYRIAATLASSPNGPSGLAITTPDGTRRIVGGVGGDKTVRFYEANDGKPTLPATAESPEGVYREVAVFRMDDAVTNLQMTGDGMRLIIHLQDGSARVWDIRDPEERRKDLQAEWAERVPAGAYLDTLWATDTPDDKLRDAVINDASLTPLRRLVAAEMLEERLEDDRWAAEEAFTKMKQAAAPDGVAPAADAASITSAVRAAAAAADMPKRVKTRVIALAAAWQYKQPEATTEQKLAEENKQRLLAEATLTVERFQSWDTPNYPGDLADLERAVATRDELLGEGHADSAKARWMLGIYTFARGKDLDTERRGVSLMRKALSQHRAANRLSNTGFGMQIALAQAEAWVGQMSEASDSLRQALDDLDTDEKADASKISFEYWGPESDGNGFDPSFHGKSLLSLTASRNHDVSVPIARQTLRRELVAVLNIGVPEAVMRGGSWIGRSVATFNGNARTYLLGFEKAERLVTLLPSDARVYLPLALYRYRENRFLDALTAAHRSIDLCTSTPPSDDGSRPSRCNPVLQQGVVAMIRHHLSTADDTTLAAVAEIDGKPGSLTGGKVLDRDGHRAAGVESLTKARALMSPAPDGTPSPWADDADAQVLLAEAEALFGAASP